MIKGRGAGSNPSHRFENYKNDSDFFEVNEEELEPIKTQYIPTYPKTIVNKVISSDIPLGYSLNPYQGCEHGCVYCFARPTHNYWGYSSGLDFEQKILVKKNVVALLTKKITSKQWRAQPIALSGNTDCYQPAEVKYRVTRSILETMYKYRHPVSIITKNKLVLRDLDILEDLNKHNLVSVAVSITTLDKKLHRILEPRTSTPNHRFQILKTLSEKNIPAMVMMGPIIPGLTDHEILNICKKSAENGAYGIGYNIIRLNDDLDVLFDEWLENHMPDRRSKIMNHIRSMRKGKLSATQSENRMRGTGKMSEIISDQFKLAKKKYFKEERVVKLNTSLHLKYKTPQLSLF